MQSLTAEESPDCYRITVEVWLNERKGGQIKGGMGFRLSARRKKVILATKGNYKQLHSFIMKGERAPGKTVIIQWANGTYKRGWRVNL